MKKLLYLVFSIFALVSCAPHNYMINVANPNGSTTKIVPIYMDAKWSDEEEAALSKAITQWNNALNGYIVLEVKDYHYKMDFSLPDPGYMLIKSSEKDPIIKKEEQFISLAFTRGRGNGVGGNRVFFVTDRLIDEKCNCPWENEDLTRIALHELGHTLGADHIKYNGLMNATYSKENYKCIDQIAIIEIAKYQDLPADKLKYCEKK